ncbi:MAG: hypothetical protein ABIJ18_02330 [archaeon]
MPFDQSLDKELFGESVEFETTKITVSVMCYNEGAKKLQISRQNKNKEDAYTFNKLGRMTKEEAEAVLPLMQKALEHM